MTYVASVVSCSIVCLQNFTTDKVKNLQNIYDLFKNCFWRKDNNSRKIANSNSISCIVSYFAHQREIFLRCINQAYIISTPCLFE